MSPAAGSQMSRWLQVQLIIQHLVSPSNYLLLTVRLTWAARVVWPRSCRCRPSCSSRTPRSSLLVTRSSSKHSVSRATACVHQSTRHLSPVYTIQPVVNRLSNRFDNRVKCLYTRYNRLLNPLPNRLSNRFHKRLYRVYSRLSNQLHNPVWQPVERTVAVRSTRLSNRVCQTGCTTRFDNRFERTVLFVQHGCQTGLTTELTTGWMFVYTIQPVVKPVVQPVWQPVVSCKRGFRDT